jgi:TetR/AcrR family transcriptional regulator, transcriptional repressor for nem operon
MATDTKQNLIDAACDLLWERGYEGTSPAAILERSGAGQGSLYHHFHGKADLAAAALAESVRAYAPRTDEQLNLAEPGSAIDHLCAYLAAPREVLRGCRFGRLANEPAVLADATVLAPIQGYFTDAAERLTKMIVAGQAAGEISQAIAAPDLALTLLAVVQGGYVLSRISGDAANMERAAQGAIALLRSHAVNGGVA